MTAYLNQNQWASLARAQQQASFDPQMEINGYMYGNSTVSTTWDSTTTEDLRRMAIEEKKSEPSKFKKLTNHRFHDLLDKFNRMSGK